MGTIVIKIEVPDGKETEIMEGAAKEMGYQDTLYSGVGEPLTPNPQSKEDFFKDQVAAYVAGLYKGFETKKALKVTETAKKAEIDALDIKADLKP